MNALLGLLELFLIFILPLIVAHKICVAKGRNPNKGVFVALFTGWLGVAIIWLFLEDRSIEAFDRSMKDISRRHGN
jgi:hypothetical protein